MNIGQLEQFKKAINDNRGRIKKVLDMDIPEEAFELLKITATSLHWHRELVQVLIEEIDTEDKSPVF